jgi:predicted PurR-regulated permease PerM
MNTESIRRAGTIAWQLIGIAALIGLLIWVGSHIAIIFPPLVFAGALIYIINPLVDRFAGFGMHRLLASCLSYVVVGAVLTVIGFLAIPVIAEQGGQFVERFPTLVEDASDALGDLTSQLPGDIAIPTLEEVGDWLGSGDNAGLVGEQLGRLGELTLSLFEWLVIILLVPVLALYIITDLPHTRQAVKGLVPEEWRNEVTFLARQINDVVGGFVRGQLLVALIVGIAMSLGFLIIDLPFWLIIGLLSGLLNVIPFVGPWVGGLLGGLAGLSTGDPANALYAGLIAVVVQQLDNHVVSPIVMRVAVRLHPVVVIVGLLAGGQLAGLLGVLLAVPVIAVLKVLIGHWWRTRMLGQSWEEAQEAMIEVPTSPVAERIRARIEDSEPQD